MPSVCQPVSDRDYPGREPEARLSIFPELPQSALRLVGIEATPASIPSCKTTDLAESRFRQWGVWGVRHV